LARDHQASADAYEIANAFRASAADVYRAAQQAAAAYRATEKSGAHQLAGIAALERGTALLRREDDEVH
jgi:hypothetical protein